MTLLVEYWLGPRMLFAYSSNTPVGVFYPRVGESFIVSDVDLIVKEITHQFLVNANNVPIGIKVQVDLG